LKVRRHGAALRTLVRRAAYNGKKGRAATLRTRAVFARFWRGDIEPEILVRAGDSLCPGQVSEPIPQDEVLRAFFGQCLTPLPGRIIK